MFSKSWLFALTLFVLPACQQFHTESQADASVNFASYKTYSFSDAAGDVPEGFTTGHLFNSIMQERIRSELYRDLTNKGFAQAARGDASFIISFSTGGRQDVEGKGVATQTTPEGNIQGAAGTVSRGALVIHFVDAKTKKLLWRGWVEAIMEPDDDLDEKVRAAVREVMQQFPPKAG